MNIMIIMIITTKLLSSASVRCSRPCPQHWSSEKERGHSTYSNTTNTYTTNSNATDITIDTSNSNSNSILSVRCLLHVYFCFCSNESTHE